MYKLGEQLRKLRGRTSLRDVAKKSGVSYSYISSLEKGKHPKTGAPINPAPDKLRNLANAYNYSYEELMKLAGHIDNEIKNEVHKEKNYTLETIDQAIFEEFMKMDPKKKDKLKRIMDIVKEE